MDREQALQLLKQYVKTENVLKHMLASEAIMRSLARKFNEDEEQWGIIGLLHDIDWDLTKGNPKEHCTKAVEILKKAGIDDFIIETIVSHGYGFDFNEALRNKERSTKIQHALAAAETLTGLIVAAALMQPDKKLSSVRVESLKKKFKDKRFAANCSRDIILECEKIGLILEEFLEISLQAMQGIAGDLGL